MTMKAFLYCRAQLSVRFPTHQRQCWASRQQASLCWAFRQTSRTSCILMDKGLQQCLWKSALTARYTHNKSLVLEPLRPCCSSSCQAFVSLPTRAGGAARSARPEYESRQDWCTVRTCCCGLVQGHTCKQSAVAISLGGRQPACIAG